MPKKKPAGEPPPAACPWKIGQRVVFELYGKRWVGTIACVLPKTREVIVTYRFGQCLQKFDSIRRKKKKKKL